MYLKKGSNRFVFIFPSLGFVLKIPRIFIRTVLKIFLKRLWRKQWKMIEVEFSYNTEQYGTWARALFKGISDNWSEFEFYQNTRHIALEPTYFSLFGFLNIQQYGKPEKINYIIMGRNMVKVIGEDIIFRDPHHLTSSSNFSFRGGKIRFCDYGSPKTRSIITDFGCKIFEGIDVTKLKEEHELLSKE